MLRRRTRNTLLLGGMLMAATAGAQSEPVLGGSFVQLNAQLTALGPDGWISELSHMRDIGMDTLIVQYSRYGDVTYYPTGVTTGTGDSDELPPTESMGTLTWAAPAGTTARYLRVSVTPNSREWTMMPEIRVISGEQNIAAGSGYALSPAPSGNYLDPGAASGGKLTDGFANFAWSDMVGWQHAGEAITVDFDLGSETQLDSVEAVFMRSDISGVELPASIQVLPSPDGSVYSAAGDSVGWSDVDSDVDMASWDPLGEILEAAGQVGFQVWLGLSLDPAYWQGQFNADESATANIALMLQLEALYGDSPSLAGYYLPEEIDDRSSVSPEVHTEMISYLVAMAEAAHELGRPVMVAPYFGINPDAGAYAAWWDTTLSEASIDVIALQDGVGTRRTTAQQGVPVYRALKEVADRHGVELWSDLEVFWQTHGWPVDELAWQAVPTSIDNLIEQLALEAPYVSKFVAFDFTHYMSPRLGGPAAKLYEDYAAYLEERTQ